MKLFSATLILMFFVFLVASRESWAQQTEGEDAAKGWEWGVHTGPLLPNQIEGVTEIMPTWGARVGFPSRKAMVEVGATSSRAYGVSMYDASLSYRGDIVVEGLTGIFYAGLDIHHITPADSQTAQLVGGGHIGAGLMTLIGDVMWFRTDMKFNMNPGTALYIGFGLQFRLPAGEGGGDSAPAQ